MPLKSTICFFYLHLFFALLQCAVLYDDNKITWEISYFTHLDFNHVISSICSQKSLYYSFFAKNEKSYEDVSLSMLFFQPFKEPASVNIGQTVFTPTHNTHPPVLWPPYIVDQPLLLCISGQKQVLNVNRVEPRSVRKDLPPSSYLCLLA
jgi:hypothetical protein